jgi:hypothetical protein
VNRIPRLAGLAALPALALIALVAWMFASPIGSGADDDFHLVSTWCASPAAAAQFCAPTGDPATRDVPDDLVDIACFASHPEVSAACQDPLWTSTTRFETDRGNWIGAYPPVYYAVMSVFAGPDIQTSALLMRLFTIVLFLGITVALYVLLPVYRRPALLWTWLISTLPLGLSLFSSNNPSAWAMIGVGSAFFALLGYFETAGRARIALGGLFAVSVLMAAGSRGDSALYAGFAIAIVLGLKFVRARPFLLQAILPLAMGLVALAFFLSAQQVQSGLGGFGGSGGATATAPTAGGDLSAHLTGFALLAYNLLNIPFLWSGVFGTWGLGWLDTSLPWAVPLALIAVFVAAGFAGLARKNRRTAIAALATFVVLWALPAYVLQRGGDAVGDQVQPRYLFPLIVLLAALLMLAPAGRPILFGRVQALVLAATLTGAYFISLHFDIRRYVTGIDGAAPNLDAGAEWWWVLPLGPTAVWLIGTAAYGALVFIVVPRLASGRAAYVPAGTVARPITR